jgi:hypothetical protein
MLARNADLLFNPACAAGTMSSQQSGRTATASKRFTLRGEDKRQHEAKEAPYRVARENAVKAGGIGRCALNW